MSDSKALGWRQLCLQSAESVPAADFCSLDLEHDVEELVACLSKEELAKVDLDEFREFLRADATESAPPRPRFEETLRRELWWTMVQGLAPGGVRIPQA